LHLFLFFTSTTTTDIYTLSLHDALPICVQRIIDAHALREKSGKFGDFFANSLGGVQCVGRRRKLDGNGGGKMPVDACLGADALKDRKSTRLNSSHVAISYAVFCLKKKR